MGEPDQARLIRKIDLERFLGQITPHPSPKASFEQYTTSESVAATMLYLAAYNYGDIVGKRVLDLGCGTGRLGLGAAFLGAESVVGIDIDRTAVCLAVENSVKLDVQDKMLWVNGDVDAIKGKFDTVVENPPFGVQKRTADRRFLEKALEVGRSVYSFHNHPTFDKRLLAQLKASGGQPMQVEANAFLRRFIEDRGGHVEAVYALPLTIHRLFNFHTKTRQEIVVDLYVIRAF